MNKKSIREKNGATSLQGILFSRKHIIRNLSTRNFFYKEFPSQESHNKEFFLQGISFTRNLTTRNFTVRNFFCKEFLLQGISQQGKFFARNFFTKNFETRKYFTRNFETRNLEFEHVPQNSSCSRLGNDSFPESGDQNCLARKEKNNLFFGENFMKKEEFSKKLMEKIFSANLKFCDL
jgi:hypothetical protein